MAVRKKTKSIYQHPQLTPLQKNLYVTFKRCLRTADEVALTYAEIAAWVNCSERSAARAVRVFEDLSLFKITRRGPPHAHVFSI